MSAAEKEVNQNNSAYLHQSFLLFSPHFSLPLLRCSLPLPLSLSLSVSVFSNPITIPSSLMDSNVQPWLPLSLLLLYSLFPLSLSSPILRHLLQSNSPPQHMRTSTHSAATAHPDKNSDIRKIAAAVIITAAISFALSGLLFFSIHRLLAKRRKPQPQIYLTNPLPPFHCTKIDRNHKSAAVDDSGLDVFYWQGVGDFSKRCYYCNSPLKQSSDEEEDLSPAEKGQHHLRKDERGSQDIPLLPSAINNSSSVALDVVKGMQEAPPPPPPPPPVKSPPPQPPALPAKKGPAPPPPPAARRCGGPPVPAGFSKPPLVPERGKDMPRFKPLHWDKVTPANAGHSMVWDKIADGSTGYVTFPISPFYPFSIAVI